MPRYGHSKIGGVPKTPKFEMPITPPLGVLEQKNFGFPSFSIGGTFTPKMIKIGEIRVLSYFDLSWNEPFFNYFVRYIEVKSSSGPKKLTGILKQPVYQRPV